MAGHKEIELKLEFDPADADSLRRHPLLAGASLVARAQHSTYYDTRKQALRKAGYTLRIRRTGDAHVQTVKRMSGAAGLFDRSEWEAPVDDGRPDAEALAQTPVLDLLGRDKLARLRPVLEIEVERSLWRIPDGAAEFELVLDQGSIAAAGERRPVQELEIELKRGEPDALFAFARSLFETVPLRIGVLSKAEQGFALADGTLARSSKAGSVPVQDGIDVAAGFSAIVHACIRHFRLNEPLVAGSRDPEALHQARVAMRRLRSAFSLFAPALRDEEFTALRDEVRWFTNQLGDARNLDVFLARLGADASAEQRAHLEAARERAYDQVVEALGTARFRRAMLELVAWVHGGRWRRRRKAGLPLRDFAARRLDRLWRKVLAAGHELAALDEEARHRLRIEIKKLRYAVEFFAILFDPTGRACKRIKTGLEGMQESLGHLNDIVTAGELIARLGLETPGQDALPAPADETARHLADARRTFTRLAASKPFWGPLKG